METKKIWHLGIACSHNGAACLLLNGEIFVAIQEERLSRIKRDRVGGSTKALCIDYCLQTAGIDLSDLAAISVCFQSRKQAGFFGLGPEREEWIRNMITLGKFNLISHHFGHAVSAFVMSGLNEANILIIDGMGSHFDELNSNETSKASNSGWEAVSLYSANLTEISPSIKELCQEQWLLRSPFKMPYFNSIGGMYSAVAVQIFDEPLNGPGKVMGLAPFGNPIYPISEFVAVIDNKLVYTNKIQETTSLFKSWPKCKNENADLAASAQKAVEFCIEFLVSKAMSINSSNLCYAGGVALNSVANEYLIKQVKPFNLFIPSCAEDSGTAIGAAYHANFSTTNKFPPPKWRDGYFGRQYSISEIDQSLSKRQTEIHVSKLNEVAIDTAKLISEGAVIGWFQGRSEFGPRALGNRSILGDPRTVDSKAHINNNIKHREPFRPLAPLILEEFAAEWLEDFQPSNLHLMMLAVGKFKPKYRTSVPAIVHIDNTSRIQVVKKEVNPLLHSLLTQFYNITGVPVLINTSLNVMGEPIVETPGDALNNFLSSNLDYLILADRIVSKVHSFSFLKVEPDFKSAGNNYESVYPW